MMVRWPYLIDSASRVRAVFPLMPAVPKPECISNAAYIRWLRSTNLKTRLVKSAAAVACSALLFGGCSPKPDTTMGVTTPVETSARIAVTRIGVIEDSLAYGGRRGIYIITDTKTGKEYVGVSGIGISELGSHSAGKTVVGDER